MVTNETWVMLSYRIPREPSTPRIAVWRKLKRLGVVQIGDGLVALPYDSSTKEALEWVANSVYEADGEASIWVATPTTRRWGRELSDRMADERALEYTSLLDQLRAQPDPDIDGRSLIALRRELRRIQRRDFFPPPERAQAVAAMKQIEDAIETAGAER